ncbi:MULTISPECIES: hypothetical protein [unclassified Paenibacillus]|uniref:hypothetical protein n=1 Tax=unclassified Paenibacillus TaxID=185978 RepID=UPI001AEAD5A4|nr:MULTISPECIES: hypothetical protein [unclassified Paenibacillus]MBP1153948.1 hypothetical protein [Paenibacillus sp. PvP091]MBP1170667.1 hypothetical protein [Paenibacillus sp. PvR098]MBP2441695.1 hypothetical protein [Paenibacillus sp. PvP052]
MEDKVHKIIAELDDGSAFTITYTDPDGEERCYDLWLDKEDTIYRLQTIYLLDGKPEEVGETFGYSKLEITRKLVELSAFSQFHVREWD